LVEYQIYRAKVESIDTYASISSALSMKLKGIQRLLDIGNGGVFDYDTTLVQEIIGLDLFLDNLPVDIRLQKFGYVKMYCTRGRAHSTLDFLNPLEYER
jgi:hypothetical protein